MLGLSTCLSAVLCYMYVTKPVIVAPAVDAGVPSNEQSAALSPSDAESTSIRQSSSKGAASSLIPSDSALPGMKPAAGVPPPKGARPGTPQAIDPRQLLVSGAGTGWEATNSRVQHILSADIGNGERTKIVLNVPVLYQTRTMRWTPTDVKKAREILTRLMVYENSLSKIKQEGKALLIDWNQLLGKTVPAPALRADSPSLPNNHSRQSGSHNLPDSGSTIKIEP